MTFNSILYLCCSFFNDIITTLITFIRTWLNTFVIVLKYEWRDENIHSFTNAFILYEDSYNIFWDSNTVGIHFRNVNRSNDNIGYDNIKLMYYIYVHQPFSCFQQLGRVFVSIVYPTKQTLKRYNTGTIYLS